MADITAGLPTLRPEEEQARQDRARIAAMRAPLERAMDTGTNALLDVGTMIPRALVGLGNQLIRVPNALGASIPMQRLPGDSAEAIPQFTAFPFLAAGAQTGGATGSFGEPTKPTLPAMTAPVPAAAAAPAAPAPVQTSAAPRTPKSGGTKTAGAMPAGAPAPLVPGETGFFMNDQLVPYGTRFLASGDGTVRQLDGGVGGAGDGMMDGLPGGGKMVNGRFADPRDALEYGFRLQRQMFDYGLDALSRVNGGELGAGSRMRAIASMLGTNNAGQVSVGGANALNSALAAITSAETSAGATMGSAGLHLQGVKLNAEAQKEIHATDSVPLGTAIGVDPVAKMAVPLTTYGRRGLGNAMPTPYDTKPALKPVHGKTYTDANGNSAVYNAKTGSYDPVK